MNNKPASFIAVIFFSLMAIAHLFRLFLGVEIIVDGTLVPIWLSAVGLIVPAGLAFMLWREQRG